MNLRLYILLLFFSVAACTNPNVKKAIESKYGPKGTDAVERLTKQPHLEKVAIEAKDLYVRLAALKRILDQSFIAKIALQDIEEYVRLEAINRLTDVVYLANIAVHNIHSEERSAAVAKLNTPELLSKLSVSQQNNDVKLIYNLISKFEKVPQKHRTRLINAIFPVVLILSSAEVSEIIGEIITLDIDWKARSQHYRSTTWQEDVYRVDGEKFKCAIQLSKFPKRIAATWATKFPSVTRNYSFIPAKVNVQQLLDPVFKQFPERLLEKIADGAHATDVRFSAKKRIKALQD